MKSALLFAPALMMLAHCAPKASVVEEPPAAPTKPATNNAEPEIELPAQDNLGLLEPPRLGSMPTPKDMKPTVGSSDTGSGALIATPGEKTPKTE